MEDLKKVSAAQLYTFWKNLSVGLLAIIALIAFSAALPYYFSPIVALLLSAGFYALLYNSKLEQSTTCLLVPYSIFFCLITYSFVTIILNVLYIWGIIWLPAELTFFSAPYLPSLALEPICFIVMTVMYLRRDKLRICMDCKIRNGSTTERGKMGNIINHESHFQIKNLIIVFGVLTVVVWAYYLLLYIDTDINARDWYVFIWLNIIVFVADELYFIFRYYNLYLDLKENNEIITQEELRDMTSKTYLRFYVICEDYVYLDDNVYDKDRPYRQLIDTPFVTKRSVNGITVGEVSDIIRNMTGVKDGTLRFFFGRKIPDMKRSSLLRYFYFLKGNPKDYNEMKVSGKWMPFDEVKRIYSFNPGNMTQICVSDITRLATIMLTRKIYDENGFRRIKLKSYRPSFTLPELEKSDIDFQDDKWIQISMFNADTNMYRLKRWWRNLTGGKGKRKANQWN